MVLFINKVISSIIQIVLFSLIPFIWWLITARKKCSFFKWLGLKRIEGSGSKTLMFTGAAAVCFIVVSCITLIMTKDIATATSEFDGLGFTALPAVIIYAFLNTALSEEILFRGFIGKRLSAKLGFAVGNIIQAALFGMVHGVMFFSVVEMWKALVITVVTGIIAWFMGYINERKAGGSIIPSWIIHGLSNLFAGIVAAFSII